MINLHILLASGKLAKFEDKIRKSAEGDISRIIKKINIDNVDIVIRDNTIGAIPEIGIGGITFDTNYIAVSLNPDFPDFDTVIENELNRTLAHELHHSLRMRKVGHDKTLLEALISEGLADHFDIEVFEQKPEPWSTALTEEQKTSFMEKARLEFNNENYNHDDWFFGSKDNEIPRWSGYSLGFKLIGDYLVKNPDQKPSTVFDIKADDFI